MIKKNTVNYFFFTFWFLLLFSFSFLHLPFIQDKLLFIFHSFSQILLEVLSLVLILYLSERFLPALTKPLSGLVFFIFIFHLINLFMVRLMDSSIFFAIKMLFGGGIKLFFTSIRAIGLNSVMLVTILSSIILIPLLGALIYHFTAKLSAKKPLSFLLKPFLAVFFVFIGLESTCESIIVKKPFDTYRSYLNKLPFAASYLAPKHQFFTIKNPKKPKLEEEISKILGEKKLSLKKQPNIFLFVVESFRKDALKSSITPTLTKFKNENISFTHSFSGANGSNLGWFSIFYSQFPLNWNYYQKNWKEGAAPLRLLKSLGYTTSVFSSTELNYFNMDKIIFGQNLNLANIVEIKDKNANIRDYKAFEMVKENLSANSDKNLFVVFLDSTHSEYTSPELSKAFTPVCQSINYFDFLFSAKDLPLLKNRYYNSLNYLDSLFKDFFDHLKKLDLYDDAIVIITADHGEEFLENGSLFHGTHLNSYQTNIPIIYKIPGKEEYKDVLTSQVDIFPTILHYLTGSLDFDDLLDGQSIFHKQKKAFSIVGAENGGNLPEEFVIYHKNRKILAQKEEDKIKIIAVRDFDDKDIKEKASEQSFDIFLEKQP